MTLFFLIPVQELTTGMILKSNSTSVSSIPIKTISGAMYYVLEVERGVLKYSNTFENYTPYNAKELDTAAPFIPSQFRKFIGAMSDSVNANSTKTTTYTVPENRYMTGFLFKATGSNFGDTISLVVKSANDAIINTVCSGWFVDDTILNTETQKTLMIAGIKLDLSYTNTGLSTAKWFLNLRLWSQ